MDLNSRILFSFFASLLLTNSLYAQWSVNWLHRFGSSKDDGIFDIIVPANSENRYWAIGYTGASDTPGVIHKGKEDGVVLDIKNGQIQQILTFGGSDNDKLMGGMQYNANLFVFWGESASSDGDINYHPDPGVSAGWIVFTDSSLNIIRNFIIQPPNSIATTFCSGIAIFNNNLVFNGRYQLQANPSIWFPWLVVMDVQGNILYSEVEPTIDISHRAVLDVKLFSLDSVYFAASGTSYDNNFNYENFFYIAYYDSIQNKIVKVKDTQFFEKDGLYYVSGFCNVEGEYFFISVDQVCNMSLSSIRYFKFNPGGSLIHLGCQPTNLNKIHFHNGNFYLDSRMRPLVVHNDSGRFHIFEGDFNGNKFSSQILSDGFTVYHKVYFELDKNKIIISGITNSTSGFFSGTQNHGQRDLWIAELYMPSFSLDDTHVNRSLLQVYPNPAFASSPFQISVTNSGLQHVQIFNFQGQNIPITYTTSEEKCILQFVSDVPPGTYLLSALDESGRRYSTQLFILPD